MKKILLAKILMTSLVFAITPIEIAKSVKKNSDGYGSAKSTMEMTLIDQAKNEAKRTIKTISYENVSDNGEDGDKSLMEFISPLDVKGTKFLSHEKINKNNNQWLYLPALKRIKRINSKSKSGSFMGSEFSYEDISSREVSKYDYSKEVKEAKVDGVDCFVYERYPKDKNSGYSKQVMYVDKNKFITLKAEFYDKKKELLKTAKYEGYQKMNKTYRVKKITMNNHQNYKATTLVYLEDEINLNLEEKIFSKRYLKD